MAASTRKYNPGFLTDDELVASFCVRTTEFEMLVENLRECTGASNPHQTRDRSARQREDEPAAARRGRGAPGRRAGGALLPGRLRGRKLRGLLRGGVLAGVPDAPGRPGGAVSGRRTRPRPHRRRAAHRPGRPGPGRPLSRRAAGFRGPARSAAPAAGREPEHAVQGYGGPGRGLAAAEGPADRTANHPVRERDQPLRRDRRPGPRPVRPFRSPHAAPARHGPVRRALGSGGRPAPPRAKRCVRWKSSPAAVRG